MGAEVELPGPPGRTSATCCPHAASRKDFPPSCRQCGQQRPVAGCSPGHHARPCCPGSPHPGTVAAAVRPAPGLTSASVQTTSPLVTGVDPDNHSVPRNHLDIYFQMSQPKTAGTKHGLRRQRWVPRRHQPVAGPRQSSGCGCHQEESGRGSGGRDALSTPWITHLRHAEDPGEVRIPEMVAVAKHRGDNSCW